MNLDLLTTEQTNPASLEIDTRSSLEIVGLMNAEDQSVATAVSRVSPQIAQAIDLIARQLAIGGRLFYIGAGTSGRLGVLDASECPPTFNTDPGQVIGIIAGGPQALTRAIEGAEDDLDAAEKDLSPYQFSSQDVLVGIATSGRTPYVLGGLRFAKSVGATTIGFSCNQASEMNQLSDVMIVPVVGPEVISGSTRLKSGTATKMVLNMLTTGTMVLLGKTYGNWMVDLRATNTKLKARSLKIVKALGEVSEDEAKRVLDRCDGEVKVAIVAARRKLEPAHARELVTKAKGKLREALNADL
jgi:N-acetylmuramic acid 6-phosphate etherase